MRFRQHQLSHLCFSNLYDMVKRRQRNPHRSVIPNITHSTLSASPYRPSTQFVVPHTTWPSSSPHVSTQATFGNLGPSTSARPLSDELGQTEPWLHNFHYDSGRGSASLGTWAEPDRLASLQSLPLPSSFGHPYQLHTSTFSSQGSDIDGGGSSSLATVPTITLPGPNPPILNRYSRTRPVPVVENNHAILSTQHLQTMNTNALLSPRTLPRPLPHIIQGSIIRLEVKVKNEVTSLLARCSPYREATFADPVLTRAQGIKCRRVPRDKQRPQPTPEGVVKAPKHFAVFDIVGIESKGPADVQLNILLSPLKDGAISISLGAEALKKLALVSRYTEGKLPQTIIGRLFILT